MKFLLDTTVVSPLRVRGRNKPVEAWAASIPLADQFVTATTVAEIERGVIARERSDTRQGTILRRWFDEHVLPTFVDRVLPFDLPAARILAAYRVPEHAPFNDALIAAVAQSAELTVATRNTKHLVPLGVPCVNPWTRTRPPPADEDDRNWTRSPSSRTMKPTRMAPDTKEVDRDHEDREADPRDPRPGVRRPCPGRGVHRGRP